MGGKATRLTEAQRLRHDAIEHLNIHPITYSHAVYKKRHLSRNLLFVRPHDDIFICPPTDTTLFKDFTDNTLP